jgi:hypothetical protein
VPKSARTVRRLLALALGAAVTAGLTLVVTDAQAAAVALPTPNAVWDYQIGGARTKPTVTVLSRDRGDEAGPVAGLYNICYVNAFQTQPIDEEIAWWRSHNLLLQDAGGDDVIDGEWNEILLDIRTDAKRQAIATKLDEWIDGCADAGYQAIEPDNLDSFTKTDLLTPANAIALIRLLIAHAHQRGLAIAQKNAIGSTDEGGVGTAGRDAGLDFAIAEECGHYHECGNYQALYGNRVYVIEYSKADFTAACTAVGSQLSVVRRNRDVTPSGPFEVC